ncbi:hypothetical protein SAMN05444126_101138 [Salisediminibacterium halotolerans]|uniref:NAD(P)-dependent dehydrogenase, short-chain alcohol dehydrogenase family n=2 Tax=Salisediminibacterium halotolerans TaxID=517425 RepID=A0A1H9PBC0_9BACI|nr:hypothetical protein SAMN05444126_101138 [Salisediminibacterium haloalkalitolerans]
MYKFRLISGKKGMIILSLTQRHTVVTGGAHGIGAAVAKAFAAAGDKVTILDISNAGRSTAERIDGGSGLCGFQQVDIADPGAVQQCFHHLADQEKQVDVLINNAGLSSFSPLETTSVDDWDRIMNTNVRGTFICIQQAAKLMPSGSSIVNIASTRGLMSEAGNEAYAASKGALLALTHAAANSLTEKNIRVNAVSPGWIHTGNEEELRQIDHAQHLSGRVGEPQDVARACLFLSQKENDFINGENIVIDGGMTKKMIYEH